MLTELLKKDDAREQLRILLGDIEAVLYASKKEHGRMEALAEIAALRPFLADRSPSIKMIFEHIATAMPIL